nr:DNA repair and recombination protein RadA [Candidatus Njordarchaeum guaymaensis]
MTTLVDELKTVGVAANTISRLRSASYTTCETIVLVSPKQLAEDCNLSVEIAEKVRAQARKLAEKSGFINKEGTTALDLLKRKVTRFTIGCETIDKLLGGGVRTGVITEFAGEFRTGKTNLSSQGSITVQLPIEKGGLAAAAVYIDTEGSFRAERVKKIAERFGLSPNDALRNILYFEVFNTKDQIDTVKRLFRIIPDQNIKLVVLDSMIQHFRAEYPGRENLATRQQRLNLHLQDIKRLMRGFDCAFIMTNQVQSQPDAMPFKEPNKPTGGNILFHASDYRVILKKGKGDARIAKILDAPDLDPNVEVTFNITDQGVEDISPEGKPGTEEVLAAEESASLT